MREALLEDVTSEIKAAFYAYEAALTHNRLHDVNAFFLPSERTARFGADANENQYGFDAITRARLQRGPVRQPERTLVKVHVSAIDENVGIAHAEYVSEGADVIGRQSQTWFRTADGWKIASAHVSFGRHKG